MRIIIFPNFKVGTWQCSRRPARRRIGRLSPMMRLQCHLHTANLNEIEMQCTHISAALVLGADLKNTLVAVSFDVLS